MNDTQKTKSPWISPKERLPETDEAVLVIVNANYQNLVFRHACVLAEYIKNEGWILNDYPMVDNLEILYWAELPELPKEFETHD